MIASLGVLKLFGFRAGDGSEVTAQPAQAMEETVDDVDSAPSPDR